MCKGKPAPRLTIATLLKNILDFVQAVLTDQILDNLSDNSSTQFSLSLNPRSRHCHLTQGKRCSGAIKMNRTTQGEKGCSV